MVLPKMVISQIERICFTEALRGSQRVSETCSISGGRAPSERRSLQSCCPGSRSGQSRTPGEPRGPPRPSRAGLGHWQQREQKREGEHGGMLKHLQQSYRDSVMVTICSQILSLFTGYQTFRVARLFPPRTQTVLPGTAFPRHRGALPCCSAAFSRYA